MPYPTLYISHGAGGNEADWFTQGVAGNIIDNLIAAGKMQPTVVVSTNFNGLPNGVAGYQTDVLTRVIPFIEANFHVSKNANDRAFGGLSAGGQRANQLIFNATNQFGYFASWSIGGSGAPAATSPLWQNPDLKNRLGLVIGGGRFDSITIPSKTTYEAQLTTNGIPFLDDTIDGGHEWYTWRLLLNHYAASVAFRQTSTAVVASTSGATATVTPGTNEPTAPTGTVQFSAGGVNIGASGRAGQRQGEHPRGDEHQRRRRGRRDLQRRRVLQHVDRLVPVRGDRRQRRRHGPGDARADARQRADVRRVHAGHRQDVHDDHARPTSCPPPATRRCRSPVPPTSPTARSRSPIRWA